MQLAASGDEKAFRQLTRSAMPQALRVARNVFSSREAADIMETNDVAFQQLLARARTALKAKVMDSEWEFK
ncbi:hypothetical protein [Asticcacaulis sp. AND118]|uniref:hypothetical protein n=1 Tax=Asticcacaulis sp. AND118 TaxID=2840468 RepID=UPI001CFFAA6A|nr:hypothetical protein [Asticcacaulis sp. AND118]UDF04993.1 hypothetical protein LH365_16500 [Asticcacaulis sp. AND118]